jgi:hypothetical protein
MEKTIKRLIWILAVHGIAIGVLGVVNWNLNKKIDAATTEMSQMRTVTLESLNLTLEAQVELSKLVSLVSDQSDVVNLRQDIQLEAIRKWIVTQKPTSMRFD